MRQKTYPIVCFIFFWSIKTWAFPYKPVSCDGTRMPPLEKDSEIDPRFIVDQERTGTCFACSSYPIMTALTQLPLDKKLSLANLVLLGTNKKPQSGGFSVDVLQNLREAGTVQLDEGYSLRDVYDFSNYLDLLTNPSESLCQLPKFKLNKNFDKMARNIKEITSYLDDQRFDVTYDMIFKNNLPSISIPKYNIYSCGEDEAEAYKKMYELVGPDVKRKIPLEFSYSHVKGPGGGHSISITDIRKVTCTLQSGETITEDEIKIINNWGAGPFNGWMRAKDFIDARERYPFPPITYIKECSDEEDPSSLKERCVPYVMKSDGKPLSFFREIRRGNAKGVKVLLESGYIPEWELKQGYESIDKNLSEMSKLFLEHFKDNELIQNKIRQKILSLNSEKPSKKIDVYAVQESIQMANLLEKSILTDNYPLLEEILNTPLGKEVFAGKARHFLEKSVQSRNLVAFKYLTMTLIDGRPQELWPLFLITLDEYSKDSHKNHWEMISFLGEQKLMERLKNINSKVFFDNILPIYNKQILDALKNGKEKEARTLAEGYPPILNSNLYSSGVDYSLNAFRYSLLNSNLETVRRFTELACQGEFQIVNSGFVSYREKSPYSIQMSPVETLFKRGDSQILDSYLDEVSKSPYCKKSIIEKDDNHLLMHQASRSKDANLLKVIVKYYNSQLTQDNIHFGTPLDWAINVSVAPENFRILLEETLDANREPQTVFTTLHNKETLIERARDEQIRNIIIQFEKKYLLKQ